MSKAIATLEDLIQAGNPCLVCPRCGWWQSFQPGPPVVTKTATTTVVDYRPTLFDYESRTCPDCKGSLDGVEKPVPH